MNTKRSQRLQRVTDVAEHRTEAAAGALAERVQGLGSARRQLKELQQFRQDYARAPTAAGTRGMSIAQLRNRQQFVARIDDAIDQQQHEVEQRARNLAQAQTAWINFRSRSAALDTVTRRWRGREQADDARIEQAAIDERMQRPRRPWTSR